MMKKIASLFVLVILALSMIVSPVLAAEDKTSTVLKSTITQESQARHTEFSELSAAWDNAFESGNKGEMYSAYERLLRLQSQVEVVIALLATANPVDGHGDAISIESKNYYKLLFTQLSTRIDAKLTIAREVLDISEPGDYVPPPYTGGSNDPVADMVAYEQKFQDLVNEFKTINTRVEEIKAGLGENCNGNEAELIAELNSLAITTKEYSKDSLALADTVYASGNRDLAIELRELANYFDNLKQSIEPVIIKAKSCETDLESYTDDLSYLLGEAHDYSVTYGALQVKLNAARCDQDTELIAKIKAELTHLSEVVADLSEDASNSVKELVALGETELAGEFRSVATHLSDLAGFFINLRDYEPNPLECQPTEEVDSDNDGVIDENDDCANTTAGATVNANGCSTEQLTQDTDNDGIVDSADNCPSNANHDQADADSDGVGDVCDTTPNGETDPVEDDKTPQEQYDEMESEYESYEDDFDYLEKKYKRALRLNDDDDIEKYDDKLDDLDEDLKDLEGNIGDLIDELENEDNIDEDLVKELEDLEEEVEELRDDIDVVLDGEEDNSQDTVYSPPQQRPSNPVNPVVTPILLPELSTPEVQSANTWEDVRSVAWLAAGIIVLVAIVLFLIGALIVKK
jgi:hypothetical protein